MLEFALNVVPIIFPFESLDARFMQLAMLGLLLLAPVVAVMGVHVVNHRLAFFSDAVGHSAFTGLALSVIFAVSPKIAMPAFAVLVGILVVFLQRRGTLSSDTVIGVVFSGIVAVGLAIVSRERNLARDLQKFLYGDILTISEGDIKVLALLALAVLAFQAWGFNRLVYVGLNPLLAKSHGVRVSLYQYIQGILLSAVVIFAVWAVGILLVTALLVVPAAAAKNLSRSALGMFYWSLLIAIASAAIGLIISAQDWASTATGATVVLCSCVFFVMSLPVGAVRGRVSR
jgi:zinc transport system permease protein